MGKEVGIAEEALTPEETPDDRAPALVRHTAVMSLGTGLSRITGFLRLGAMAWAIGIAETRVADAYNAANTTPNIIYELALGGILSSVFVPVFVEWLETKGRDEAWDVARRVMSIALVALTAITLAGIIFAPWIIKLYTVGISDPARREATRELATFFLRWFLPQIVFYGIGAVATGLLNAHRRFAAPMFAPILNNLVAIATFVTYGVMAGKGRGEPGRVITADQKLVLAIGTTVGVVFMTAALWPSLRRLGFRFKWRGAWRHEAVIRIAHLAKWTVVYVVANQVGYLVVLVLALHQQGGYTAYGAAFILFQLPYAIFAVSIFTALLPAMSSRWTGHDVAGFRSMLSSGLRMTGFVLIPAAFGYIVLAQPIVRLLLQHGVTGQRSADLVGQILVFFSLGLFSFAGFQLLLRAFYSMQDSRTPALINLGALAVNVGANLLFVYVFRLGVRGLALGHAVSYTFAAILAIAILRKRLDGLDEAILLRGLGRILLASAATAVAAGGTSILLDHLMPSSGLGGLTIRVLASVASGLIVFIMIAAAMRMEELVSVKQVLRATLSK